MPKRQPRRWAIQVWQSYDKSTIVSNKREHANAWANGLETGLEWYADGTDGGGRERGVLFR